MLSTRGRSTSVLDSFALICHSLTKLIEKVGRFVRVQNDLVAALLEVLQVCVALVQLFKKFGAVRLAVCRLCLPAPPKFRVASPEQEKNA